MAPDEPADDEGEAEAIEKRAAERNREQAKRLKRELEERRKASGEHRPE